tara:strand:- start:1318 stop:1758 length:441 start_codon:yes stop_codon:yes gene_type:complete
MLFGGEGDNLVGVHVAEHIEAAGSDIVYTTQQFLGLTGTKGLFKFATGEVHTALGDVLPAMRRCLNSSKTSSSCSVVTTSSSAMDWAICSISKIREVFHHLSSGFLNKSDHQNGYLLSRCYFFAYVIFFWKYCYPRRGRIDGIYVC